jgi:hypothetical protein
MRVFKDLKEMDAYLDRMQRQVSEGESSVDL